MNMSIFDEKKRDGFTGERMFVLPIESFQEYAEHPKLQRLYLTDVGFFPRAAAHYRERKDGIEEYIFIYCMEGSGVINLEGNKYTLHEKEAFCIPRFKGHKYYACEEDPWSILWVHFKGTDVQYYPVDECRIVPFISNNATNRMLSLFELLFQVLERNYTLGNFLYSSQVLSLILSETYDREKSDALTEQNKHVTNIIRYMYNHLSEELTLEQLSEQFQLSKSYMHAAFQKHTQHAPIDFFVHLKIKEACKKLKSTDLYIYQVAQELGYSDQFYFSRIFKKVVGVSPKEYRDSAYFFFKE